MSDQTKQSRRRSTNLALTPWPEVRERWNRPGKQDISRTRVMQICKAAERKLHKALQGWETR